MNGQKQLGRASRASPPLRQRGRLGEASLPSRDLRDVGVSETKALRKYVSPRSVLIKGYQTRWVDDGARWKYGLMSRQVGKDFMSGFEGVQGICAAEKRGERQDWLIVAPSERQSLESLAKWKEHVRAFDYSVADFIEKRESGSESLLRSGTIVFPGGSRVIAVPGKPDTVRGYSANVLLTEFAFFEQPDATWRAILPSITNSMRGGVKKVRLITTPNGVGNKAHELWVKNYLTGGNGGNGGGQNSGGRIQNSELGRQRTGGGEGRDGRNEKDGMNGEEFGGGTVARVGVGTALTGNALPGRGPGWSCHFVDIYRAAADGLPVDVEELREALDDAEGWAQEFECQFLDTQSVLLPYELQSPCESAEATVSVGAGFWESRLQFPLAMGIDFGRHRDLSVAWSVSQVGDVAQTLEVLELEKMSTPAQMEMFRPRIRQARRVCVDCTGAGVGLGDYLVKEFGEWNPDQHKFGKIELCAFSNALKLEIFSKLRLAFERKLVRIPVSRVIREDLHLVNRVSSAGGQITYRAAHSPDGHADRCTALALALRACEGGRGDVGVQAVRMRTGAGNMGMGRVGREVWL